ncbi:hypothetical protein PAP_09320 [Palaeococcus pacificus DY20341]|uniref:DUF5305 domain-containing protein n=1 Tax=Palaeococcus pacificus DY20341 TaxID=1343739 RepID=A0A075LW42_9EURY|nr:DUF5305 family protein [Palaeococcus pacificus]AIF70242.1 hypothetical protein PAP_09320 [Palaeococcus pacificus DY20341]
MKIDRDLIEEYLKKYLTKKAVLGVLVVLVLVFSFYSVKLMGAQSYSVINKRVATYTQEGVLLHTALLKNNTLYGDTLSREEYPIPLVENFLFTYRYRFNPGDVVRGNYSLTGKVTYSVNKGNQEVVLWEEELFSERGKLDNGKFLVNFGLNLEQLNNRTNEISEELGLKRLNRKITFEAKVDLIGVIAGKEVKESFTHTMNFMQDSTAGLYYFTNEKQTTQEVLTNTITRETSVRILGITTRVSTAKKVIPALLLLFLTPLLGGVYTIRSQMPPREFKGLEAFMIEGVPQHVSKKVFLASKEDLKKTFDLVDKPIMHYKDGDEDVYVIVDEGIAYEYREMNPKEQENA